MKVTFTKEELEKFKNGAGCSSFDCSDFCCSRCPVGIYIEDENFEEAIEFIEEHLEK